MLFVPMLFVVHWGIVRREERYLELEHRDQVLKIGMAQGINMAHNRLQDIVSKLK